ncbi:MAG TPA: heme-binding protein, partial [Candidatus Babeliales bacterium]|nr:heme-binding protein [Candidatus Babeliales bacterium]
NNQIKLPTRKLMTITDKALSLNMAKKMADAAEAKAIEKNLKIVVAIMDNHGNLKYYRRMDGNAFISIRMAQLKASTSASMPISTKDLAARNETMINKPYLSVPNIVLLEGGLPIMTKDGQHIGSIGISGATPELDGICAQAGLDILSDDLS